MDSCESQISILVTLPYSTYLSYEKLANIDDIDVSNFISNFLEEYQDVA